MTGFELFLCILAGNLIYQLLKNLAKKWWNS